MATRKKTPPPPPPAPPKRTAADAFLDTLRCPETGLDTFEEHGESEVLCTTSRRSYPVRNGVIDFMPTVGASEKPSQRLMEQSFYSAGYEEYFRPLLTRLVSSQSIPDAILLSLAMLAPKPGDYILDVGCGTGNFTRAIARRLQSGEGLAVGLDLSAPMVERAEQLRRSELLKTARYVRGDAHRLPFADGVFDSVHCAASLQLMPEPERALAEMERVLKPGGRLVIATFIRSPRKWLRRVQFAMTPIAGFRWFDPELLHHWLESRGLELREEMIEGAAITVAACKPMPKSMTGLEKVQ